MFGSGVLRGMMVTLRHFVETYTEDPRRRAYIAKSPDAVRQTASNTKGLFTVQYPEEKLAINERFRFFPMLIVDGATGEDWCTSCGICAKVCPPQCIYIVRGTKPDGKPKPEPEEFYIDTTICMQCGFCAEFCPFDAIKMNHDYELSVYERLESAIYDKDTLSVTTTYYARTHPRAWAEESAVREAKEAKEKKPAPAAAPAAPAAAPAVPARPTPAAAPVAAAGAAAAAASAAGATAEPGAKPKPMSGKMAKQLRDQAAQGGAGAEPPATPPPAAPAEPGQQTLPSGKPKPISGKLAKQMRDQAAQQAAQGGATAAEAPAAGATASEAAAASAAAAAAAQPGQDTLPSGKPKPISGKLAKQMRDQARAEAAQGGASAPEASAASAPVSEPPATPAPSGPEAAAAQPGQETLPSGKPKPISGKLAKQMRDQARAAAAQEGGNPPGTEVQGGESGSGNASE
ncbi:MAG: NADH-quinone oxidoreductase subunit I [Anaerolineae bacterium]